MQKVDFIKMHGLGNDFVIIDQRAKYIDITQNVILRPLVEPRYVLDVF